MNQAVLDFEKAMTRHLKNFQDPKRVRGPRPEAQVAVSVGLQVELAVRHRKEGVSNYPFIHTSRYTCRDIAVDEAMNSAKKAGWTHVAYVVTVDKVELSK